MTRASQISTLESSGLIALAGTTPEIEYIFRHALIHDVVYESVLKSEKVHLHHLAGETLERLYPDRREELSRILAEHFSRAGDFPRALEYFLLAAERARQAYANTEAVESYSSALRVAGKIASVQSKILRERGKLYEIMGEFEQARTDHEAALQLAETAGDSREEWQSLISLGMLWAARDYQRTGEYYSRALALARTLGNDRLLASSLNWVGNYEINMEQPEESRQNHEEALAIFTRLEDEHGTAETLDLLGMSCALGGNLHAAKDYLDRAVELFEKLGDLQSLSSSLSSMGLSAPIFQTDTIASTSVSLDEGIRIAERSYRLASDIGWRSGRVFALCTMAMCLIAVGNFDRAITSIGEGIQIAEEIGHRQWETYLSTCNGALFLELLNWEKAQDHLEKGLAMAELNHSPHWVHTISGALASALVAKGDLSAAEKVLDRYLAPETPHQTLGQRLAWFARSELALASGRPEDAMEIAGRLSIATHSGVEGEMVIRLWLLKGEILMALAEKSLDRAERERQLDEAEELLSAVLEETRRKNYRTRVWRIHKALARFKEKQGRVIDAERERQAAREIVLELSGQISDPELRSTFVRGALGG